MTNIRTRFAPSPTGYIHIGNVRSALFPWLLARQQGGNFILRIEDTDQARFIEGATELIVDTLTWLGLDWDEGYQKGGNFGPYIQTERKDHYLIWAQRLIDKGLAYADPYTPEQVNKFRQEAKTNKKAFLFRDYRPYQKDGTLPKWDGTQPLRFMVPNIKRYSWHDEVMGDLSAGPEALDDFILIKSDGLPTYNFAHIVDDSEMKITHIIRGLEYIPSIPKYLSLYEALGLEIPKMACLPHILASDGKKKLGKRDGAKSVQEYKNEGILPEAMLNFLASMGWNDGTEQEIFSCSELINKFSLDRVQKSGARFDEQRLIWMNGQWIRRLSIDDLFQKSIGFWPKSAQKSNEQFKKQILILVKDRLKTLCDIPVLTSYFFEEPIPNLEMITTNKQLNRYTHKQLASMLITSKQLLIDSSFDTVSIQNTLNSLLDITKETPSVLFSLIRLAISWAPFSPALNETISTLEKEKVISRLDNSIEVLSK